MSGVSAIVLLTAGGLGWGLALLRFTGVERLTSTGERLAWGLVAGIGTLGWLGFVAALLFGANTITFAALALAGLPGLWLLRPILRQPVPRLDPWSTLIVAALAVVAMTDVMAALLPPTDADSLAYHFAVPKRWLVNGQLDFLPLAVDGAVPLLLHVTYAQALALGGELGLTLWCGLSAWCLPLVVLSTARRSLPLSWALALALAIKTMPAVVYGASSGQVEVRLAALFCVALLAASRVRGQQGNGPVCLAGLLAGFCMGAKYSALLAPALCGMLMLGPGPWLRRGLLFTAAALVGGGQWYLWNWIHTGDPLFPVLWGFLPYRLESGWDDVTDTGFKTLMQIELAAPKTLQWLLAYPFRATFAGLPVFESGRTGFGPLPVLLLPFAMAGAWTHRRRAISTPWLPIFLACLGGYGLWFSFGQSQRVRHFLPYLVPALMVLTIAAHRAISSWPQWRRPLLAAFAVTITLQMGGLALVAVTSLRALTSGETRDAFYARNVAFWPLARWLNGHLGPADTVMLGLREIIYLVEPRVFYGHAAYQGLVPLGRPGLPPRTLYAMLRRQGISHFVVGRMNPGQNLDDTDAPDAARQAAALIALGCAENIGSVLSPREYQSRILALGSNGLYRHDIIRLIQKNTCLGDHP